MKTGLVLRSFGRGVIHECFKKRESDMANKSVFKSAQKGKTQPAADTTNLAGGAAYKLGDKAALAQYAATGTFNDTYYSTGEDQIAVVLGILPKVDVEFVGKVAIYSREQGRMKDMPSLLAAHLSTRGEEGLKVLKKIFPFVIDNGRMLRNFAQIIRSGKTGRKSFGTASKNLIRGWFDSKEPANIFKMSVGNDPSLGDILEMVNISGGKLSPERQALFKYLKEVEYDADSLPPLVKEYEAFKKSPATAEGALPKVPFEMLMGLSLTEKQWRLLADQASWTQLRMNLNTFSRHGVFKIQDAAKHLAAKLKNPDEIKKAKPFPYQLMITYLSTQEGGEEGVPRVLRDALHDALDIATENVPTIEGPSHALIDVSGSMSSPVTGTRQGATSKARCVDVAALIGSAFLRKNKESMIIPYSDNVFPNPCEARDSVMTNAQRLASLGGGGTNLSSAFVHLNKHKAKGNLVVVCSDMETWADGKTYGASHGYFGGGTVPAQAWAEYKSRNPKAKLVCINLQAGNTCQVTNSPDVLNIGGWSDTMWEVIKSFVEGTPSADHWVSVIEAVKLPEKS